jgi:hypothetical protein
MKYVLLAMVLPAIMMLESAHAKDGYGSQCRDTLQSYLGYYETQQYKSNCKKIGSKYGVLCVKYVMQNLRGRYMFYNSLIDACAKINTRSQEVCAYRAITTNHGAIANYPRIIKQCADDSWD